MRILLLFLVIFLTSSAAQDIEHNASVADAETDWMRVPFEERERLFRLERRDSAWAQQMEQAIAEKIATWTRPAVNLLSAECRETLCRISMLWPPDPNMPDMGQQLSSLYGLGIDHQGATDGNEQDDGYQWLVIARRR